MLSIFGELRAPLELGSLMRSDIWRGRGIPEGDGTPVLTIPGLFVGGEALWPMRTWLARLGYRPYAAGIRSNVRCSESVMADLETRLERITGKHGAPVRVVGQSRGGMLAHVLAVRRPDLVGAVVTLGSPIGATIDDFHPVLRTGLRTFTRLGDARVGLLCSGCWVGAPGHPSPGTEIEHRLDTGGSCCERFWPDLSTPLPGEVLGTAVYSRTDGVIAGNGCVAPGYHPVEARTSHAGMATSRDTYHAIALTLARAASHPGRAEVVAIDTLRQDRAPVRSGVA